MEPKKNPKADVGRNSSLYFAIGLLLILFITNYVVNFKDFGDFDLDSQDVFVEDEIEEDIPIIQQFHQPPPPPPQQIPVRSEVLKVVDNKVKIEEPDANVEDNDSKENAEETQEIEELSFNSIETIPILPGCEYGDNSIRRACVSDKVKKFVSSKFNLDLAKGLGLSGRQQIDVLFKIDKLGNIIDIRVKAPHPVLEKETSRVIALLPKMQPGKHNGKPVIVQYSLPISFSL